MLEALVAMLVTALLLAVAVPVFRASALTTRLNAQMYDFAGVLNYARSEAVTRGSSVTVCKSSDGVSCGGGGVTWENGWTVFLDGNANGALDAGETVVRSGSALVAGYTLRPTVVGLAFVTFASTGVAQTVGGVVLCEGGNINPSRAIFISSTGRIRVAPDANQDGIPEDPAGAALTTCTP